MNVRELRAGEQCSMKCHFCGQVARMSPKELMVVELEPAGREHGPRFFMHDRCIDRWKIASMRFHLTFRR